MKNFTKISTTTILLIVILGIISMVMRNAFLYVLSVTLLVGFSIYLFVVAWDQMLLRLDWNSAVKWAIKVRAHHDVSFDEEGLIYAVAREDRLVFENGIPVPILDDYVLILSAAGEVKEKGSDI